MRQYRQAWQKACTLPLVTCVPPCASSNGEAMRFATSVDAYPLRREWAIMTWPDCSRVPTRTGVGQVAVCRSARASVSDAPRSSGPAPCHRQRAAPARSEEHTSELQSLMRISYAVFCLKQKKKNHKDNNTAATISTRQQH